MGQKDGFAASPLEVRQAASHKLNRRRIDNPDWSDVMKTEFKYFGDYLC